MADKTYVVTAACAMVKVGDRFRTVQQGGALPPGADPDHVKLLIGRGMVEEGELVGGIGTNPDAAPPFTVDDAEGETAKRRTHAAKAEGETA